MSAYDAIYVAVLASLKANGLAVVRNADTTMHRDDLEQLFAKDVASNASMCIEPAPALRHQIDQLQANFAAWVDGLKSWRPSDSDNHQPIQGTK